jgi:hypothetical protein
MVQPDSQPRLGIGNTMNNNRHTGTGIYEPTQTI